LLSAFPKLVASGKDHTFIETETVRYVYQPMESLYLLLVTKKSSNIVEDLDTLRLLAQVVQNCCKIKVDEQLVLKRAFDLIDSFDEVISVGGHRESATLPQIEEYTNMYSYEEQIQQEIEKCKMNEAIEEGKRREAEIAKYRHAEFSSAKIIEESRSVRDNMKIDCIDSISATLTPWVLSTPSDNSPTFKPSVPKNGMVLTKKNLGDVFADLVVAGTLTGPDAASEKHEEALRLQTAETWLDAVKLEIKEMVVAELLVDGTLKRRPSCSGELSVTVLDESKADLACFKLSPQHPSFRYKVHPTMNKSFHANSILELRDNQRAFSANTTLSLLKWQYKIADEEVMPVILSCWPTPESGGTHVAFELELVDKATVLEDVCVRFKIPFSTWPHMLSADPGQADFDAASSEVRWCIPLLNSGERFGNMAFTAACDMASLMYIFEATRRGHTRCPMDILECYHQEKKDAIGFAVERSSMYRLACGI
jgi:hypothetical protein